MAGKPSHVTSLLQAGSREGWTPAVSSILYSYPGTFSHGTECPQFQMDLPIPVNTVSFTGMLSRLFPWQFFLYMGFFFSPVKTALSQLYFSLCTAKDTQQAYMRPVLVDTWYFQGLRYIP